MQSHDLQAQHDAQEIAARLDTTRRQLREWHVRRAKELAQEQQRYFPNTRTYKSLKHVDKALGEAGHQGINAVRLQDGTVTDDPKVVLEEVLNSFLRQHNTEDGELSAYTEVLISHLPKLYNRSQRQKIHRTPFTIRELDEVLYKLRLGKNPRGGRTPGGTLPQALAEPEETLGRVPVGYRHRENEHTTRLGKRGTPAV